MLHVVIEKFRDGDDVPVYRRYRDSGRLAPNGLAYVASWVTPDLKRCYQVMECENRALLDEWMTRGTDLVEFEGVCVISSAEAAATIAPRAVVEGRPRRVWRRNGDVIRIQEAMERSHSRRHA